MSIANVTIGATNTTIINAAAQLTAVGILLCNFGSVDETVTVYAIKSGGSAGNSTTILKSFVLPAANTYSFDFKLILDSGDSIVAIGTVGAIVAATPSYLLM